MSTHLHGGNPSLHKDLEDAICLLALVTKRPPVPEDMALPSRSESFNSNNLETKSDCELELTAPTESELEITDAEFEDEVDDAEDSDDLENLETEMDEEQSMLQLQDKFLDRLAETLARFKSSPSSPKKARLLDAKHVSSTMLAVDRQGKKTKIFGSKNEGFDKADKSFYANGRVTWKPLQRKVFCTSASRGNEEETEI